VTVLQKVKLEEHFFGKGQLPVDLQDFVAFFCACLSRLENLKNTIISKEDILND
jgi:hypothetical protein